MSQTPTDMAAVAAALEQLRDAVGQLTQRVAALEEWKAVPAAEPAAPSGVDEDLVMVLSAAIAAYLGEKPRIRQIRLVGSSSWTQQGRATVQASHELNKPPRS